MKTGIIICSTPYQIMVGALLKKQCFTNEDKVDLILTDTFNNYEEIGKRIRAKKYYCNVYVVQIKHLIVPNGLKEKFIKGYFFLFYKKEIEKILGRTLKEYDEVYFNSEEIFTYNLISVLRANRHKVNVYRYEEGYSSYSLEHSSSHKSEQFVNTRNKLFKVQESIKINGFYVFEPDLLLFQYDYPILKIKRSYIAEKSYINFISNVFCTDKTAKTYNKKYIIFEESFVTDGFKIDDLEMYSKLIEKMGSNNVSVKIHPRSNVNRFSELNVDIHVAEGIPWEAILLTRKFENITLIALASGSVINSCLLTGDSTKAYLLYKCLKKRPPILDENFEKFLTKFCEKYHDGIVIPKNLGDVI